MANETFRSRGVQFDTVQDVVDAYRQMGIPTLAIWCGRQLMFPFETDDLAEGAAFLEGILEKLTVSAATYTLCVYDREDLAVKGRITSSTPYRASFNFQLKLLRDANNNYLIDFANNKAMNEVAALRAELEKMRAEMEAPEELEGQGMLAGVERVLNHPVLGGLINNFLSGLLMPKSVSAAPTKTNTMQGTLGNVPPAPPVAQATGKLQQAISFLLNLDPDFEDHLYKLAELAEKNPDLYFMLIKQLGSL